MISNRRTRYNFSFDRAVEWCERLNKPLLVFEALRSGYPWASDRLHRFVLQGMADNREALEGAAARYYCYVELKPDAGSGLLEELSKDACVIVTDDFPCFFLPRMLQAVAPRMPALLEAIDSNGLLPMRSASQVYASAYAFRRFLQRELPNHLGNFPAANPLARKKLPQPPSIRKQIKERWPEASAKLLEANASELAKLPIDHSVGPTSFDGGAGAAEKTLKQFLDRRLADYNEARNEPDEEGASGLSPYLHFGHISAHDIFHRIVNHEVWSPEKVSRKATGKREGWWNLSEAAEGFLDELITWRELGYNMCWQRDDYDEYDSLPAWAKKTLAKHAKDKRDPCYGLDELERAATYDELWNAAQTQLVSEGRLHNYMRMLWGKKILQWAESPQEALRITIHLNNKYAVDGRNPNSYSGIFWCLGRYDRPWGPERKIFGKVRYMSSENTARKFSVQGYLERYRDRG
jgi:deoxyribodipyrimidine photo-lyase